MATLSSHTLNSADGTHAGGIAVTLSRLDPEGPVLVLAAEMDEGGRLSQEVDLTSADPTATYELVFAIGPYWAARDIPRPGPQIMNEVVFRFAMPDPSGRYHIPVILSPNGCAAWWSA